MTLLTIAQAVMDESNLVRSGAVIGNQDPEVQKILRFANRIGGDLLARGAWQALRARKDLVAVPAEAQAAAFPDDFGRMAPETFWDQARGLVAGPVSPVQWAGLGASGPIGTQRYWTRRGNDLLLYPTPAAGQLLSYEYYSSHFCASADGLTTRAAWQADTDVGRLPEELFILGIVALLTETEGDVRAPAARAAYESRVRAEARNDLASPGVMTSGDIFGQRRHFAGAPVPDGAQHLWP
ncbi:phage adaptor protein [Roseococcus pinisoli]|uniref:Uncharacterized protein n=1 Tax=Roseococcus pinisoli TaxID=2835040 RepID=A0ABS5QE60_9PROT|nr:hypothetical protein [Roseococcus pinisoli]MBS7811207.1 hypothetical protein [Roseococcus pinisoli]